MNWNPYSDADYKIRRAVSSCVELWIEICTSGTVADISWSAPAWSCELKYVKHFFFSSRVNVSSCVELWIEIRILTPIIKFGAVSSCVELWIEIFGFSIPFKIQFGQLLRGAVNWNNFNKIITLKILVSSCVELWIEIQLFIYLPYVGTVSSCVELWIEIFSNAPLPSPEIVSSCVELWIEI